MNKELVKLWNRYGNYPSWRVPNVNWQPAGRASVSELVEQILKEEAAEASEEGGND